MQSEKIEYFSILRGAAIIAIIFTHVHQIFDLPEYLRLIPKFGQMGCQIFFLISGFFAYNTPCENCKWNTIKAYYKKRLKRIVPGYWLTIILGIIVSYFSMSLWGESIRNISNDPFDIFVNFLLLNGFLPTSANNGVVRGGWFVGTLVVFYFLTPYLTLWFNKIREKKSFPIKIFVITSFMLVILSFIDGRFSCRNNSFLYFSFVNQMPCFLLGFLLKEMYLEKKLKTIQRPIVKGLALMGISFFLFCLGMKMLSNIVYTMVPFFMAAAVFYFSCRCLTKDFCFESKIGFFFKRFGELDYAIMLIHPFIVFDLGQVILRCLDVSHVVLFFVLIPVWYVVIYFSSYFYSKIILKFSRSLFG